MLYQEINKIPRPRRFSAALGVLLSAACIVIQGCPSAADINGDEASLSGGLRASEELHEFAVGGETNRLGNKDMNALDRAAKALFKRELAAFEAVLQGDEHAPEELYYGERVSLTKRQVSHQIGHRPICLVTHSTPSMNAYVDISAQNQSEYASTWGYHLLHYQGLLSGRDFMNAGTDNPVHRYGFFWQKTRAVQEALALSAATGDGPLCEWVMWVDGDTLFTNFSQPIERILARYPGADTLLAREQTFGSQNLINAGVYLVKNTRAGNAFIDGVVDLFPLYRDGKGWGDQDAVHHYALSMPYGQTCNRSWDDVSGRVRDDIVVTPSQDFDSFYRREFVHSTAEGFWHPGDFLAHFAGMSLPDRVIGMNHVLALLARREGQS